MTRLLHAVPWGLVGIRGLLAFVTVVGSVTAAEGLRPWLPFLLVIGVLSDVLDGVIARRLGIATPGLRVADSMADLCFWLAQLFVAVRFYPEAAYAVRYDVLLLMAGECLGHGVSLLRFGRAASTHSYLSKLWGLSLLAAFLQLYLSGGFGSFWRACLVIGLVSQFEVAAIVALLPEWRSDVPTVRHALRLRRFRP